MERIHNLPNPIVRALVALLFAVTFATAADRSLIALTSREAAAFSRYVQTIHESDPFAGSGTVAFSMTAAVPDLYKAATVISVRKAGDPSGPYLSVAAAGDGTVLAEVIARCLELKAEFDKLPEDKVAITPNNYKFRFAGEVSTGTGRAFRYHVSPRRQDGMPISGDLWMDSATGREVMLIGRLKRVPSISGPVSVVRDTKLGEDGSPLVRITHLTFSVRGLGRAQVEFVEFLAFPGLDDIPSTDSLLMSKRSY